MEKNYCNFCHSTPTIDIPSIAKDLNPDTYTLAECHNCGVILIKLTSDFSIEFMRNKDIGWQNWVTNKPSAS